MISPTTCNDHWFYILYSNSKISPKIGVNISCGEIKGGNTVLCTSYQVVLILKIPTPDFCTRIIYRVVRSENQKRSSKSFWSSSVRKTISNCRQNVHNMSTTCPQHCIRKQCLSTLSKCWQKCIAPNLFITTVNILFQIDIF